MATAVIVYLPRGARPGTPIAPSGITLDANATKITFRNLDTNDFLRKTAELQVNGGAWSISYDAAMVAPVSLAQGQTYKVPLNSGEDTVVYVKAAGADVCVPQLI